jgi:hypothetical protein
MCGSPRRLDMKAICEPSGEYVGDWSSTRDVVRRFAQQPRAASYSNSSEFEFRPCSYQAENAIRLPSGEYEGVIDIGALLMTRDEPLWMSRSTTCCPAAEPCM